MCKGPEVVKSIGKLEGQKGDQHGLLSKTSGQQYHWRAGRGQATLQSLIDTRDSTLRTTGCMCFKHENHRIKCTVLQDFTG